MTTSFTLTETGLLACISLGIGFIIQFCRQAEQSRCKNISICCGAIACERLPLTSEAILELNNATEETKEGV
jgi:hypothetical protein|tara:strand:+ start:1014 stop:1229 length:216 start_codon:yes stop_codon:yes gene_type:complete